jgi:hypothetical protein
MNESSKDEKKWERKGRKGEEKREKGRREGGRGRGRGGEGGGGVRGGGGKYGSTSRGVTKNPGRFGKNPWANFGSQFFLADCLAFILTSGMACKIDVLQYLKDEPLSFILAFLFRYASTGNAGAR